MIPRLFAEVAPVPAAGAAALYAIGLFALLGTMVAIGMQKAWAETIGNFLRHLAGWIDVSIHTRIIGTIRPFRGVARAIRAADTQVFNAFGYLILKGETASAWCFSTAGNIFAWMAAEIADLARDVLGYAQRTAVGTIPAEISKLRKSLLSRLHGIDRTLGRIEAQAKAQLRRFQVGIDRLGHRLEHTITQAIRRVTARVGTLERTVPRLGRRVTALEKRWALPAVIAVVATALSRLGLRWIRCGNVGKAGRQICGMDANLLEALLGETLLLASAFSIVEFTKALQEPTELVTDGLRKLIREF